MEEILYNWEEQNQNWELYQMNWEDFALIIYLNSQILDGISSGFNKRQAISNAYEKLDTKQKNNLLKLFVNVMGKKIEIDKEVNKNIKLTIEDIEILLKETIKITFKTI